jgi:SAM-dependent methyltransferase
VSDFVRSVANRILPTSVRQWLQTQRHHLRFSPPINWVRFGSLRRVTPISPVFGLDRGQSIDRYYIDHFLADHAADIRGGVLEIADNSYTTRFGGQRVTRSDVLHVQAGNPKATIVASLVSSEPIPSDAFDCIILTQTLPFIYDLRAAIRTVYRILKPGGVVLATFPGICQISRYDMDRWGDYWRFTSLSAQRLFEESFPAANVTIQTHGNVLVSSAFLYGIAAEELRKEELEYRDPNYELQITVRAFKSVERI